MFFTSDAREGTKPMNAEQACGADVQMCAVIHSSSPAAAALVPTTSVLTASLLTAIDPDDPAKLLHIVWKMCTTTQPHIPLITQCIRQACAVSMACLFNLLHQLLMVLLTTNLDILTQLTRTFDTKTRR